MKLLATAALVAASLFAGDLPGFKIHLSRLATDAPASIRHLLPAAPSAKGGVLASVVALDDAPMDAVSITLQWKHNGRRYSRTQEALLSTSGCTPSPCRWAASAFEIGADFDFESLVADASPVKWATWEFDEGGDSPGVKVDNWITLEPEKSFGGDALWFCNFGVKK